MGERERRGRQGKKKGKRGRVTGHGEREKREREGERKKGKKKKGSEIRFLTLKSPRIFCDRIRAAIHASNFNRLNIFIFRTNSIIIFLSYQIN
jgi:hypothetical protein